MKLTEEKIIKIANKRNLPTKVKRIIRIMDLWEERCIIYNDVIRLCGAYIVITRDDENYVGSTKNFFYRMYQHVRFTIKGRIPKSAYMFETENIESALKLEKWLIQMYNPSLNICLRTKHERLNSRETMLLCKEVDGGCVRRKGLFDIVKIIERNDMLDNI